MTRILALSAVLAATAALPAQELEQPGGARVVRAYFDDPLVAARAVMSLEALESEYEKGYIVLRVTEEDIKTARQAGMRIDDDDDYVSVGLPSEPPTEAVPGTIAGFPRYRTVEGTYASALAIARAYPQLATWRRVGRSWKKVQSAADGYGDHRHDRLERRPAHRLRPGEGRGRQLGRRQRDLPGGCHHSTAADGRRRAM